MVMGYPNKYSVELMYWIYVRYVKIMTVDLMKNQDRIQSTYNVDDLIEILFDQMEMGQEFSIAGNYPFSDRQMAEMGVAKILTTQE